MSRLIWSGHKLYYVHVTLRYDLDLEEDSKTFVLHVVSLRWNMFVKYFMNWHRGSGGMET